MSSNVCRIWGDSRGKSLATYGLRRGSGCMSCSRRTVPESDGVFSGLEFRMHLWDKCSKERTVAIRRAVQHCHKSLPSLATGNGGGGSTPGRRRRIRAGRRTPGASVRADCRRAARCPRPHPGRSRGVGIGVGVEDGLFFRGHVLPSGPQFPTTAAGPREMGPQDDLGEPVLLGSQMPTDPGPGYAACNSSSR